MFYSAILVCLILTLLLALLTIHARFDQLADEHRSQTHSLRQEILLLQTNLVLINNLLEAIHAEPSPHDSPVPVATPAPFSTHVQTPPPEPVSNQGRSPDEEFVDFVFHNFQTKDQARQYLFDKTTDRFTTRRVGGPDHAPLWQGRVFAFNPAGTHRLDYVTEEFTGTKAIRAHVLGLLDSVYE